MVVGEITGTRRTVEIAGAAVLGGAAVFCMLWRMFAHKYFGSILAPERKKYFAYWLQGALSLGVMHLFLLYGLFDYDRNGAGRFVNWTRYVFYIYAFGRCANGMIAEFQLQSLKWTRKFTGRTLSAALALCAINAFVNDHQARLMLGGLAGAAVGIYILQLFYFDGRFKDRSYSIFVTMMCAACVGVGIAMFVTGHANKEDISRTDESIGFLVVECFFFFMVAAFMKYRMRTREHYHAGVVSALATAEYGVFALCCGAAEIVDAAASVPLAAVQV